MARFADDAIRSLIVASEAAVPLNSGTPTRFVVFRDAMGGSPVAIIVGKPDFAEAVPVRLHSACLTGDVFGSRRCDCGDQLRLALTRLEDLGGGVILYLAQEGRGLGLANKMRTYQLQDDGLDTFDANTTLGFDDDERDYGVAARMLQMLNCTRIVLLTNNPAKLDGLTSAGIEIAGRMPLEAPINADNRRYMIAKAERSGHRFDRLTALLANPVLGDNREFEALRRPCRASGVRSAAFPSSFCSASAPAGQRRRRQHVVAHHPLRRRPAARPRDRNGSLLVGRVRRRRAGL